MNSLRSSPKILVLLAAYNGSPWIAQQIKSILSQAGVNVTLLVSVDASVDGTEALVDRIASLDRRVIVLPHGLIFGGAGPNFYRLIHEAKLSKFDYVALADQDDIWLPNKLSKACNEIRQSRADAYSSNVTAFWSDGRQMLVNKSQPQVKWDFLFEAAGPGCTYVTTAKFAEDLQKFITENSNKMQKIALHDWFIYAYARAKGYRWIIDSHSAMMYRQHAQNQVGANAGLKAFVFRAKQVISGWGLSQSTLIVDAVGMSEVGSLQNWLSGTRLGYLKLAVNFWQCRRRFRDKFLFLAACLVLAVVGSKIKR